MYQDGCNPIHNRRRSAATSYDRQRAEPHCCRCACVGWRYQVSVPGTSFAQDCNKNDTFPLSRGRFRPMTMTMRKLNFVRKLGAEFLFSAQGSE